VKIQVEVFYVVMPCSVVVEYHRFRGLYCPWRWRQHGPPKRRYPTAVLHGVTIQKTKTQIFTAAKISNLESKCYSVA